MEIGMIGLGRMGGNMTLRLLKKGHSVVAFDFNQEAVNAAADAGAVASSSLEDMVWPAFRAARRVGHGAFRRSYGADNQRRR